MANIQPFQPYRYRAKAGDLNRLVTQPYDKISPEMQRNYLAASPYNLVRVILGERYDTDSDTANVYTRAAQFLESWIAEGVLIKESEPAIFIYSQDFTVPGSSEQLVRRGFIALGAVEDYAAGVVHRHEHTLAGPKIDRMEVLKHTRAHFGQIFMLYPDPAGQIEALLAPFEQNEPDAVVTDEHGTVHRLWKVADPATVAAVQKAMADKKLLIADGHHRYETALAYRNANPESASARWVMMTLVNMNSAGLRILATHRVLRNVPRFDAAAFLDQARGRFRVAQLESLDALKNKWAEPHEGTARIGLAAPDGLWLLEAGRHGRLDLNLLHDDILGAIMGITAEAVRNESYLYYVRGAEKALEEVAAGRGQAAFLVEPVPVEEVARISFGGGVMPQKSTDFYPKLLSGLTIYRLEE
ncbi:MAG: DUF1015 domain-containing protein [Bryobacterales bacterium]|nr:DUF1015 domain-containing protein [Bryobacterales bacterium]